ncbi:MAG: glycosyltransferase family 2 protein, partial [Planctomycetota bacterium]|nr:glycosyltransferase family 2 protein [Planctomycetota bacterium]
MDRITVIITTYNRPDALAAVIQAYFDQTDRNFDMIIADDGSTRDTLDVINDLRTRATFPIQHVWHQDRGFRAAAIRNRALAVTESNYVIFTDGDCIPLPSFVARHRELAEPGWFSVGNRILLTERFTRQVLAKSIPVNRWTKTDWLKARLHGNVNRLLPLAKLPIRWPLRRLRKKRWQGVMTCNMAAWRSDLLRVNGFDEAFSGWGLEDSDLAVRLINAGVYHKSAHYAAPVVHLWHRENTRDNLAENRRRLDEVIRAKRILAKVDIANPEAPTERV